MSGYNPLRHDCKSKGCFNLIHRPKIEVFHDLFPGKISFSDIDAIVEIQGNALVLEWKSTGAPIHAGQEIMWRRLTRGGIFTVFFIEGSAKTMEVQSICVLYRGVRHEKEPANLDHVRAKIAGWVKHARANSKVHPELR